MAFPAGMLGGRVSAAISVILRLSNNPKNSNMNARTSHTWKFFRAGGFDQVKLETGADLMNLDQLDQKLWVALVESKA